MSRPKRSGGLGLAAAILLGLSAGRALAQDGAPGSAEASGGSGDGVLPALYLEDRPSPAFHRDRRAAVLEALPDDAVAILLSAPTRVRSGDVDYPYHPSNDLYYLTGMTEPATVLLLVPGGIYVDGRTVREVLFVPERDPATEQWTGQRLGADWAEDVLGVESALSLGRLYEVLEPVLEDHRAYLQPWPEGVAAGSELAGQIGWLSDRMALPVLAEGRIGSAQRVMMRSRDETSYTRTLRMLERWGGAESMGGTEAAQMARAFEEAGSAAAWSAWLDAYLEDYADGLLLDSILTELREVKTEEELRFLQRAIDITAEAHREALRALEPGLYEYQIEAVIEYVFHRDGAEHAGFASIVGSGPNSTILHYKSNRRRMEEGDLVVMDIGAEYRGYTADVTRTAPVSGRFTEAQRQIYESVLEAQAAAISRVRVGATIAELNEAAFDVLARRLIELDIIDAAGEVRRFLPHGVSHYLGLDVHDVGSYGPLPAGAVVTVEPGLYFQPASDLDARWWNIGVRIEDDVLVTDSGPVVLSGAAPKSVDSIESMMREPGMAGAATPR